jgi:hypothetical protein
MNIVNYTNKLLENWKPVKKPTNHSLFIIKGISLSIISVYTLPTIIGWLPYIGISYYAYNNFNYILSLYKYYNTINELYNN